MKTKDPSVNLRRHTTTMKEKIAFFLFAAGNMVYYQVVGSYFNTYMIMQGVPLTTIAVVFLVAKVWDAVNNPLFAYLFDKLQFTGKRREKCLPWMRIGGIVLPFASIAMFNLPNNISATGKVLWFFFTYVLWDMFFTVSDVPRYAITATMTNDMDERNFLFNWGNVFGGAGSLISTTIFTLMIGETGNTTFGAAAVVVSVLALVLELPLMFLGREKYAATRQENEADGKPKFTFKAMFTYLAKNKYLSMMYLCQLVLNTFSIGAVGGTIITYYIYGSVDWTVVSTWISMIGGPLVGLILPFLLKKVDRFQLYIFCLVWGLVCSVISFCSYYFGYLSIPFALVMSAVKGLPACCAGMLASSFTLDTLEYGRYKTGIDATGINFAFFAFASKIPSAFNGILASLATAATTFVVYEVDKLSELANLPQPEGALDQVWSISLTGPICNVIVITLLLLCYKLRSKDVAVMAKYNTGEITREECDAQLSRKY